MIGQFSQRILKTKIQRAAMMSNSKKPIQNVLLIRKITDPTTTRYAYEMAKVIRHFGAHVYVEENDIIDLLEHDVQLFVKQSEIDLLVTIGGDGTVLYGMSKFQDRVVPPVLTFGKGTLGFMCIYGLQNYQERLLQVLNGEYTLENKSRLEGLVFQTLPEIKQPTNYQYHALNEFFITKTSHVLTLDIYINDILVTQSRGDGLIISTPTGSTAYSLSAGGPIVHNEVPCTIISPICPLSLSFRPIVLPEDMKIRIRVSIFFFQIFKMSGDVRGSAQIIGDGQQICTFQEFDTFLIQKSKSKVQCNKFLLKQKVIHPQGRTHFESWALKLKRLLSWNTKFSNGD